MYEDVRLKSQDEEADRYERLQKLGIQKESEYDTIQTAVPGGAKEGAYQPLKQAGMMEEVYHTLEMKKGEDRAAKGEYEALQRKTMNEDIYHIIGVSGATGGQQK